MSAAIPVFLYGQLFYARDSAHQYERPAHHSSAKRRGYQVNMSVAVIPMAKELGWSATDRGLVSSAFFWGCAAGLSDLDSEYHLVGYLIDGKLG